MESDGADEERIEEKRASGERSRRPRRRRRASRRSAETPPAVLVESGRDLARWCAEWRQSEVIAVDTEFVRERTFFPQLGLVQIGVDRGCYLVDAVCIDDLSPLADLLVRPETLKVVHSGGEDLEVLGHRFGSFPSPLFDTQIAATFAGLGGSLSYQKLVQALFRLELPKGETRSDWLRRPLSAAQLEYAVLDVAYLLPAYRKLSSTLEELGRGEWAEEEFDRLASSARLRTDPEYSFRRLGSGASLTRRERALLRELSSWREDEARRRDIPRGFVLPDRALMQLVRRRPARRAQLAQIGGMKASERARSGDEIVRRIRSVMALPESSLPPGKPRSTAGGSGLRAQVDSLRGEVQSVAEELGLPPEFLARRRAVEDLVRDVRAGSEEPLPAELRGWRRAVIGERLLDRARESRDGGGG